MIEERVVVTGLGTVNPLGTNVPEFWNRCLRGCSGIRNITNLFAIPPHMSQIAGVVPIAFEEKQERSLLFAKTAAAEALEDSGLFAEDFKADRCGVFIATAIAEISLMEWSFANNRKKPSHVGIVSCDAPYFGNSFFFNHISQTLAQSYDFRGGAVTIATGCTGGNDAVAYAVHMIRSGKVDVVLTGATEAPITPLVITAFSKISATSKRNNHPSAASRPFDQARDGFVLSEGCGILLLESLSHAKKRSAQIYAEIKGVGSMNNCYHMTDIPKDGFPIAKSCTLALNDAEISADKIDYINAHGSSTPQNDIAEANAFYQLFGSRAGSIPVTSIKSQLGHALSAANSIELISTVLSIRDNRIPPTINLENLDPECPLNVVAQKALEKNIGTVLKTSSGFSGIHTSIVLGRL